MVARGAQSADARRAEGVVPEETGEVVAAADSQEPRRGSSASMTVVSRSRKESPLAPDQRSLRASRLRAMASPRACMVVWASGPMAGSLERAIPTRVQSASRV